MFEKRFGLKLQNEGKFSLVLPFPLAFFQLKDAPDFTIPGRASLWTSNGRPCLMGDIGHNSDLEPDKPQRVLQCTDKNHGCHFYCPAVIKIPTITNNAVFFPQDGHFVQFVHCWLGNELAVLSFDHPLLAGASVEKQGAEFWTKSVWHTSQTLAGREFGPDSTAFCRHSSDQKQVWLPYIFWLDIVQSTN